jgi:hypothetical protein
MKKILLLLLLASSAFCAIENNCSNNETSKSSCSQGSSNSSSIYPHIRLSTQNLIAVLKKDLENDQPKFNKDYARATLNIAQIALQHIDTLAQSKDIKPILDEAEPLAQFFNGCKEPNQQDPKFQRLDELLSSKIIRKALCSLDPEYAHADREADRLEKAGQAFNKKG